MPDIFDQLGSKDNRDIFDELSEPEVQSGLVAPKERRFSMYDVPALAEKISESPLPTYGMDVPTVSIPVALAKTVAGLGRGIVSPLGAAATALGPVEAAGPALKAGFGALGTKGLADISAQQITTPEARPKTIPQAVELAGQVLPQLAMVGSPFIRPSFLEVPKEFQRPVEPTKPITGEALKINEGAKPHPQQVVLDDLIAEGVKRKDAEALIAGTKTIKQVVDDNMNMVVPSRDFSELAATPESSFGHAEAMEEGYKNAQARIAQVLDRAKISPAPTPTEGGAATSPAASALAPEEAAVEQARLAAEQEPPTEPGKTISEQEQTPPSGPKTIKEAFDMYDESGQIGTVQELADHIEHFVNEGIAPKYLERALRKYQKALDEDYRMAGRGDVEPAEEAFVSAIEKAALSKPKKSTSLVPLEKTLAIPEIRSNPIGQAGGVPVYSGPESKTELATRFGIPTAVTKETGYPFGKQSLAFIDESTGKTVAFWHEPTPTTLTPAESTRLKSLTEKLESGKPLTSAEQNRLRALRDKATGQAPEEKAAVKAEVEVQKVSRTEGKRPAKEVKDELVSRIKTELDALINKENLKVAQNPDYPQRWTIGENLAALDVEKTKSGFSGTVFGVRGGKQTITGKSVEDLIYQAKALAVTGPGSITIDIPGDGSFTVPKTGENLLDLLRRANRISTSPGGTAAMAPRGSFPDIADQAKAAATAYGSPEKAYLSVKRQIEQLQSQEPPRTAEERAELSKQIDSAEYLQRELYGMTKAGEAEAKADTARERLATYQEGAKGFEEAISKIEKVKKQTKAHKERLEDLKDRYRQNQEWVGKYQREAEQFEQEAARLKAALEAPTAPPSTGEGMVGRGGELQMAIVPGAKEFIEQDVIPFAKKAAQTVGETAKQMKAMASPPTMSPEAGLGAGIIREHKAKLAQTDVQMREKFHKNLKEFDTLSPQGSLAFIDRMERGGVQPTTPLHQLQTELRSEFDRRVAQVRALGTGKLQHLIQDYFPHIWKDPDAAVSWYARILGKRPLKGPASFLKRRTIPLTVDGVNAGLEPVTWNPVELSLLKFHEMDRYVMGQRIFQEFKDKGLAQFSRSDIPPQGFARIDDRVANVIQYRPTTRASGAPGAPERILRGHWFVQEDAARVLNNFLSPGLDRYKWFRAIRWIGNTMNMAQLGLSGYHFTFTMIDSGTSKLSLGMEQIAQGKLKEGGLKSAQGLVPAVNQLEYYIRGNKVLQEYTKPGSVGAEYAKIVDALMASGGRVEMPRIFRNNSLQNFFKAARTGNYPGAVIRAPFAAIEAVSYPLMQNIVPRLKLGVFSDMALAEIEKMGPNVARDEYRARLGKIWDSVDNRMGEMVYDNLFWNRNLKDLSFLAVRAVGWNLGTIRELGGGVMDAATVISRVRRGDPLVTRRMAYVVALPVTVGIMGAMYQYAKTGQGPQEMLDYFYPKTGKMLPDGTPERVNFPSYLKDIASYGMHPFKTLTNKLHPLWSEIAQMLDNKDYYGQQIRNPDDPLVKQVQEELQFVAKNFVPFSVRGAERRAGAKESKEIKAESFFGVMPISPEIARTPAQNKIMEYSRAKAPVGGRTPEEQQRSEFTRDIESQLQSPQDYAKTQQALIQAQREGKLTRSQRLYQQNKLRFERMEMGRGHSKSQAQWLWRFEHLPVDQAQHVYDISTPVEKQLFKRPLDLKIRRARQPQPTE